MKRLLTGILVLAMLLSLAACGGGSGSAGSTGGNSGGSGSGSSTETTPPADSGSGSDAAGTPELSEDILAALEGFDTTADGFVLGFSNSYNGNSFRQKEEAMFFELADALKELGVISDYIVTESNNDNATQASQIQSLVLKGVDAIIVDPGSPTALNSAIEEAWDAGVPCIIVNDGPVTTDKCYQMKFNHADAITPAVEYVVDRLGGKGNVLLCRGIAGVESDIGFYEGMRRTLDQYPDINIVAEVYGEWTGSIAQKEIASVLPSLDQVDAVIGEGGDGYGAVQAFKAANREVPLVVGGNRGNFMSWWAEEYKANGYETISWTTTPAVGAACLFVAVDICRGVEIPREFWVGADIVTQEDMVANIDQYAQMEADDIVGHLYSYQWIVDNLYSQK